MKLWLTSIINGKEVVNDWDINNEIRKLQK